MTKPRPSHEQIIALAGAGATNQQIAERFGISIRTLDRDRAKYPALGDGVIAARRAYAAANAPGHGTNACYQRGCRCTECREANTAAHYAWSKRRRAALGLPSADPRRGRVAKPHAGETSIPGQVERIEQAIARGNSAHWIMDAYGVDYATVKGVRDVLDELHSAAS
jgi:hypothetical protein